MYFKINTDMEHNYYIVRFNVIKLESPPQKKQTTILLQSRGNGYY